jgi:enoyl-CoA hydratase/carnithine racemase
LSDAFRAVIGQRQAELAIQTAKLFNPEQAFNIGLVSHIREPLQKGKKVLTVDLLVEIAFVLKS